MFNNVAHLIKNEELQLNKQEGVSFLTHPL